MNNRLRWDVTATDADDEKVAAAAAAQVVRRLIVVLLLTAAALDLTRCGLVMTAARHPAPTAGLVAAGPAAAGFRGPYTIPDTATAALGLLLAITILATAGRMDRRRTTPGIPACWTGNVCETEPLARERVVTGGSAAHRAACARDRREPRHRQGRRGRAAGRGR